MEQDKAKAVIKREKNGKLKQGAELYKLRNYKPTGYKLTTEELTTSAAAYINYCKSNPIQQSAIHQRSGDIIQLPLERPLTIEGLCNYIGITVQTLHNYTKEKDNETPEERERRTSYLEIITRIRQIIYDDKLTGAAVGIYNSNIIARDLGLTDKREIESKGDKKIKIELIPTTQAETTGAPAATPSEDNATGGDTNAPRIDNIIQIVSSKEEEQSE